MHQSIIGEESLMQFDMTGDYPDIIIACAGGGSNFAGFTFPFIGEMLRGGKKVRVIASEPSACPSLTKGVYAYDFGDTGKLTPLVKMHTLGSGFIPPSIHAGGLRYHGMAPLVSHLKELNLIEARAEDQLECFKAGILFARNEGIIPAPEATHAIKSAIDEALLCKKEGVSRTIAFNLSGHGLLDLGSYATYFSGTLENTDFHPKEMENAILELPVI
jgi:tryptophan synthase beta chain